MCLLSKNKSAHISHYLNFRVNLTKSYHLCHTEGMSKIVKRRSIIIPKNFKQKVLKNGYLKQKLRKKINKEAKTIKKQMKIHMYALLANFKDGAYYRYCA